MTVRNAIVIMVASTLLALGASAGSLFGPPALWTYMRTEGGTPPAAWTPADLGTNLVLWLDAQDSSTLFSDVAGTTAATNNGRVARWNDKSGYSSHATNSTLSQQPVLQGSKFGGLSSLYFDVAGYGGDDLRFVKVVTHAQTQDVWVVADTTGMGTSYRAVMTRYWVDSAGNRGWTPYFGVNTDYTPAVYRGAIEAKWAATVQRAALFNWRVYGASASAVRMDGGSDVADVSSTSGDLTYFLAVGLPNGNAQQPAAWYGSVIIANNVSEDNRKRMEGYLAQRWGIEDLLPPLHPYRTVNPFAWDPAYTNNVLQWLFTLTDNPTADTSYIGTNSGTLGAGAAKPTWVAATGGVSAVYSFDGGDFIYTKSDNGFDFQTNNPFSVSAWMLRSSSTAGLIAKQDSTGKGGFFFGSILGKAWLTIHDMQGSPAYFGRQSQVNTPTSVWTLVSGVYDGTRRTNGFSLYVDSVAQKYSSAQSGTLTGTILNNQPVYVGGRSNNLAITGRIDEPRIYTRALTAAEVATNFWMTATNHGWTKWDFDNRNGLYLNQALACSFNYAAAADQSTNRNHGVLGAGGAAPTWGGSATMGWYDFLDDKIQYPDSTPTSFTGPFSIFMWVYLDSLPALAEKRNFVSKYDATGNNGGYDFRYQNDLGTHKVGLITRTAAGADGGGDANYTMPTGSWVHVAGVYNATNSLIMVNGKVVATIANTVNPGNNSKQLTVGNFGYYTPLLSDLSRPLDGKIRQVQLFGYAFTQSAVSNTIFNPTKSQYGY